MEYLINSDTTCIRHAGQKNVLLVVLIKKDIVRQSKLLASTDIKSQ